MSQNLNNIVNRNGELLSATQKCGERLDMLSVLARQMSDLGALMAAKSIEKEFSVHNKIKCRDIRAQVEQLADIHEDAAKLAKEIVCKAKDANDISTYQVLGECIEFHEKSVWMLRSIIA